MSHSHRLLVKLFVALGLLHCGSIDLYAQDKVSNPKFAIPDTDETLPGAGPMRRADWFRRVWHDRRSSWENKVATDQGSVVFLGDSITQGFGEQFQQQFPGLKTANRGISGDTTRGMLWRLSEDVIALHPKAVVMLMGTNDIEEKAEPEVIAGNIRLILDQLKASDSQLPIVVCQVFPSSASKSRSAEVIKQLNQRIADSVRGDPQITLLDTWTLFADAQGDAKKDEFPDLLHPNKLGYEKWGAALRPIFATLGLMETEADDFKVEAGYESLFNGHDLTGWGFLPTAAPAKKPSGPNAPVFPVVTEAQNFDGQVESSDGRYAAIHGRLVVKTPTEGRRIQQLWTTREFGSDFTLKLEFRATPNADSGVFIRKPQLQCRDYPLAGPYKELTKYKPQEWNELEVVVRGGTARCTCNGELLEAEFKVPETGPIGLEGDRGQMEYRRIRIKLE